MSEEKQITLLKQSDLKPLREKYHSEQNGICPILGIPVPFEETVVDHMHSRSHLELGEDGNGQCRGIIHRGVNVIEGKIFNSYIRTGTEKLGVDLPTILRNLADYLENPPLQDEMLIHPNEVPKPKKLGKRAFNKIAKMYANEFPNKKPLEYPKSCKPTKLILELSEKYQIPL